MLPEARDRDWCRRFDRPLVYPLHRPGVECICVELERGGINPMMIVDESLKGRADLSCRGKK